jgi:hypothetical protein
MRYARTQIDPLEMERRDYPPEEPAPWSSFEDQLSAFLETHPDYDLDDAVAALIWGVGEDDEQPAKKY